MVSGRPEFYDPVWKIAGVRGGSGGGGGGSVCCNEGQVDLNS